MASKAFDELCCAVPNLASYRNGLELTVRRLYRGVEWPPLYLHGVASVLSRAPWASASLSGATIPPPSVLDYAFGPESLYRGLEWQHMYQDAASGSPDQWLDCRWSRQFEACVVVGLWSKPDIPGHIYDLVRSVLSGIHKGLGKRGKRHPLEDIFNKFDDPQTTQALVDQINQVLAPASALYPLVVSFLREFTGAVVCGEQPNWISAATAASSDLFGIRNEPSILAGVSSGASDYIPLRIAQVELRPFTAADFAKAMTELLEDLAPFRTGLDGLSAAWRGEDLWSFCESIGRLAWHFKWLRPLLESRSSAETLAAMRKATHSSVGRGCFSRRLKHWCELNHVQVPNRLDKSTTTNVEASKPPLPGLALLRGLLVAVRIVWGFEHSDAQDSLTKLIETCTRLGPLGSVDEFHPLQKQLQYLGQPETPQELTDGLLSLMPSIESADKDAAAFFPPLFLPLLRSGLFPVAPTPAAPTGINGVRAPAGSKHHRSRVGTVVRRQRISIPTTDAPLPGESEEESQPTRRFVQRPAKTAAPTLSKEVRWAQQRVWGSNPLLIRDHIENLSDAEAFKVGDVLVADLQSRIKVGDAANGWTGALVALVFATSLSVDNCAILASDLASATKRCDRTAIDLANGTWVQPVLRAEKAYEPSELERRWLEPTTDTLDLPLPPTLIECLNGLLAIAAPAWGVDSAELRHRTDAYVTALDAQVGTGVSLPRIRLTLRARLRAVTDDAVSTMLICGDSFGLSTAPLYYACIPKAKLQRAYREAAWSFFHDTVANPEQNHVVSERVGSKLLVIGARAKELARSLRVPAWATTNKTTTGLVNMHNGLVNYTLCMLTAVAAHRPTKSLVGLRRFDFDPTTHAALFGDKKSDAAHLYRFAPLPDAVSTQIDNYMDHLRRLASLAITPPATVARAKAAIQGDEPLFFQLDESLTCETLSRDAWIASLPEQWQVLPPNWGRTFVASRGRDARIDPDHLAIVLGHLEAAGYPFSTESPMIPIDMSTSLAAPLGKLAVSTGWDPRRGLLCKIDDAARVSELGPLRTWQSERQKHSQQIHDFLRTDRLSWRATFRKNREHGEDIAYKAIESEVGRSLQIFRGPSQSHLLDVSVALSDVALEHVQVLIDEAATNEVLRIAAHNALYRILKYARKYLKWNCALPGPWLAPPTSEPTPFFPGLFKATQQLHAIRNHYAQIPISCPASLLEARVAPPGSPTDPSKSFTAFEWACGIATLSLCAFGFMGDLEQVQDVLAGRRTRTRCLAIEDLLFVEGDRTRKTYGLRGLAAVAVAHLAHAFPDNTLPSTATLNAVLAHQMPEALAGGTTALADRLCATVSVANLVELSGMARAGLDPVTGCVPMSTLRQRQLLEEGHGASSAGPADIGAPSTAMASRAEPPSGPVAPRAPKIQLRQLTTTLDIGERSKRFKLTGVTLSAATITSFRTPLVNELLAFLAQTGLHPTVASIAAYALYLTQYGTPEEKEPAWATVYKYINSFGPDLLARAADIDFLHLDGEEYADLYQELIDNKHTDKRRALVTRELAGFHRYLQRVCGAEEVDFVDLDISIRPTDVRADADIIEPQEYLRGLCTLEAKASTIGAATSANVVANRLARQTLVFAILLRGSAPRYQELAALRFKDVLATEDILQLFLRPSGHRRLKTRSARRFIDLTKRISRRQRRVISRWMAAEKERLAGKWRPTLPLFGELEIPTQRVPAAALRDAFLTVMDEAVGAPTKIHRARHLVANEELLALHLSEADLRALRFTRVRAHRRSARHWPMRFLLPRHARTQSLWFGHRHGSTTLGSYAHLPWVLLSRPTQSLMDAYASRRTLAVALGSKLDNADKIMLRAKAATEGMRRSWVSAGLVHTITGPTPMNPWSAHRHFVAIQATESVLNARTVEGVLRDVQRGLSDDKVCLTHGLTTSGLERILRIATQMQDQTNVPIVPTAGSGFDTRIPRALKEADTLKSMLDYACAPPSDPKYRLVYRVAHAHMRHAHKSARGVFEWPENDADHLVRLLHSIGIKDSQIVRKQRENGRIDVKVSRQSSPGLFLNQIIAWSLVVVSITVLAEEDLSLSAY